MKTVPKYLVRVVFLCLLMIAVCPSALSQPPDSYLPINKKCTESQIKQSLDDLNRRNSMAFVSLVKLVCKEQASTILRNLLQDRNIDVRSLAAYGLAWSGIDGPNAIPVLVKSLKNGDTAVRVRSAYALGQIGVEWPFASSDERTRAIYSQTVIPALQQALADKEPKVQFYAAFALAYRESYRKADIPVSINALKENALKDEDSYVRAAAAEVLGVVGKDDSHTVIPVLTSALGDSQLEVVGTAAKALSEFGSEARTAVPALITALRTMDGNEEALSIVGTLGKIGKDAVPQLIEALKDENKNVRLAAIEALGLIGTDAREAMPLLIALIDNPDEETRKQGIEALASFEEAVPQLIVDLGSPNLSRRAGAVAALERIGIKAVPKLTESLRNTNGNTRAGIIVALLRMHSLESLTNNTRQKLLEALRVAANDSDEVVRYRAVLTLRRFEPNTNNSPLISKTSLTDEDHVVRLMAAQILIRTDPTLDQQTIPILVRELDEPRWLDFSSENLFKELGKRAVPTLIDALKNPEIVVRLNAAETLGLLGKDAKASIPPLLEALKDDDNSVRGVVAEALMEISSKKEDLIPALVSSLSYGIETDDGLLSIFEQIGRVAIPELITAFEKSDNNTRLTIAGVLREINTGNDSNAVSDQGEREIRDTPKIPGFKDKAKLAVPNLCLSLQDKDPKVRSAVITALESVSVETDTVIPCLIGALGDDDEIVRHQAASVLRRIASRRTPEVIAALDSENAFVRKGAAFALGNVKPLPAKAVSSLKKIVDNETESLDIRRVAASSLEEAGLDMQPFFTKYNLVSPKNAACPTITEDHLTFYRYRFDTYSGRCETANIFTYRAGGGSLFAAIKRFFSGKK